MQLRDYQQEAVDSIYAWFDRSTGNPIVCAPTGAGKSLILADFIRSACQRYPGTRILVVTHVKELIEQDYKAIIRLWPDAPIGLYSAGLNKRQSRRQVVVGGVQSLAKRTRELGHVDLVIVDEAHLIPRKSDTLYGKLFDGLRDINPALKIIGLTATPYRLDSGRLDGGDGAMFDGICYDIPIPMLVERGYLAPLISKRPGMVLDTGGLRTRAGDFVEREMEARFNVDEVTDAAVSEIVTLGQDRKAWLVFCVSIDHAENVAAALRGRGITAATVTGKTPAPERARLLAAYKRGEIRALTSVAVLTTGFDAPRTDLLAFLRPTQSLGLYVQMLGRAMRVSPDTGKANGLVLDFAGNVARHGPVDALAVPEAKSSKGGGEAPTKTCPSCQSIMWIAARECLDCGHVFPEPEPKVERTASTEAVMNLTAEDDWRVISDMDVARHHKDGAPDSLRVEYLVDGNVVREWVCFEHTGFPRRKAVEWWQVHAGTTPPDTVEEALGRRDEIRRPSEAVVIREGKYRRLKRVRFASSEVAA